ncbi:MAG: hypothetical protein AAGJ87_15465, partial [Pseudomonadota bacterium]
MATPKSRQLQSDLTRLRERMSAVAQSTMAMRVSAWMIWRESAISFPVPEEATAPSAIPDADKTAFRSALMTLKTIAEEGDSLADWKNNTRLKTIRDQSIAALEAFDAAVKIGKWTDGDVKHYETMKNSVSAAISTPPPDYKSGPADAALFSARLNMLVAQVGDRIPLNGFIAPLAAYGAMDASISELAAVRSAIAQDGLSTEETQYADQLKQTAADIKQQATIIDASLKSLKASVEHSKRVQNANDELAYGTIAGLAGGFRLLATAISFQVASVDPQDKRLRIDLLKAANGAAEFANQLTSRANALHQQQTIDRRVLSTGQYLRDAKPTAFLDAYEWLDAATDGAATPSVERIEVAKQLFDDDNWAQVNEVYASGVGKTAMAFYRDEIGNWNLKSFDNDPTELTGAYAELGVDLVKRAASLATTGGAVSPDTLSTAASLVQQAQNIQSGNAPEAARAGALVQNLDLEGYRRELHEELAKIEQRLVILDAEK